MFEDGIDFIFGVGFGVLEEAAVPLMSIFVNLSSLLNSCLW